MASFSSAAFDSAAAFSVNAWDFGGTPPPPPPAQNTPGFFTSLGYVTPTKRAEQVDAARERLDLAAPTPKKVARAAQIVAASIAGDRLASDIEDIEHRTLAILQMVVKHWTMELELAAIEAVIEMQREEEEIAAAAAALYLGRLH